MKNILDKISYHAVYDDSIMEALRYAKANGFAGVQMPVEVPHLSFETVSEQKCSEIAEFCAVNQLYICLHGPDDSASLFISNRHLVEGIFDYFTDLFDFAARIGSRLITLHAGTITSFPTDISPRAIIPETDIVMYRETFAKNLNKLIELAAGRFVLCIENYKMDPIVLEVVQAHLDAGRLSLCWDLAKTYTSEMALNEQLEKYFWGNIDHIRQVHLHDIRDGRSHRVIGTGQLDFIHFLRRLARVNVLDYCIEVRPREKAAESLVRLGQLLGHV